MENVENPEQYIAAVLKRTKPQHIQRTYDVGNFETATEFLDLFARKAGRLLKGGEADVDGAAKMVLNDFVRGKLPWFTPPPGTEGWEEQTGIEGRKGMLGEMGKVKVALEEEDKDNGADDEMEALGLARGEDEGDFEGFDDDEDEGAESWDEASSGDELDGAGDMNTIAGGVAIETG